jgi:hypothetical protein
MDSTKVQEAIGQTPYVKVHEWIRAACLSYKRLRLRLVRQSLRRAPIIGPHLLKSWHVDRFAKRMGQKPRLHPPVGFNDHVLHRILYDRDPRLKIVCDKIAVRDLIRERVGEAYVVPLLGVWSDPDDIPWDAFPERFVLKPNHGSGLVALIRNASDINSTALKAEMAEWLRHDFFDHSLEWGYRDLPRRITAEPLLVGLDGGEPNEAIVMTFNGKVAAIRIFSGAKDNPDRADNWFDRSSNRLPFYSLKYQIGNYVLAPEMTAQLIAAAEKVSAGFSHLRVDFYITVDGLRIGELTPYMGAGMTPWSRPGPDNLFGQLWKDPSLIDQIEHLGAAIEAADRGTPSDWLLVLRRK